MNMLWLVPIAVLIVLVLAGWFIAAFVLDRRRTREMVRDRERLDVHPLGPTSTPRDQQDREG